MLNNRTVRIVFAILLIGAIALNLQGYNMTWAYAALVVALISISFYGSYFISANYYVGSLNKGDKNVRTVALTFDDGPMDKFTPAVLDILKENKVPAFFFLIGKNIAGNEGIVNRLIAEGHAVGNHSYSHGFWFSIQNKGKMLADIQQCDAEIMKVAGVKPKLFRPPYGVTNPMVAKCIKNGGYISVGWSLRSYDVNAKGPDALLQKILKNIKNGDVVLLHDWGPHTIGILSDLIKGIRDKGFEIVRADKLLGVEAYR